MIEDLTTTIKAQLYERVSSPLLSSFVISWCGWNYKFLLIIFSSIPTHEKLIYIDLNIFPDIKVVLIHGAILPLLTSLLLIFVYPIPAEFIYRHVKTNQRRLKEIQQSIDDESPLSKEQARKIRREALESQLKYESEIDSKTTENSRLKELISELQQSKAKDAEALSSAEVVFSNEGTPLSGIEHDSKSSESSTLAALSESPKFLGTDQDSSHDRLTPEVRKRYLDGFMRESMLDYMSGLQSFADLQFDISANNGKLVVFLTKSDGTSFPYITAEYTQGTAIDVLQSLKATLENDRPPRRMDGMHAGQKKSLRDDSAAIRKFIVGGFRSRKSREEIQKGLLDAGVSRSMIKKAMTDIKEPDDPTP